MDLKGSYEKLSVNRFVATDSPPYLVYLYDSRSDYNIANYHPAIVGKKLAAAKVELLNIDKAGVDRLALIFHNYESANKQSRPF